MVRFWAMSTWLPEHTYPGITSDRLLLVAGLVREARTDALDDHRPDKWETNWSLGVRQYERTEGTLTWATGQHPWLTNVTGAQGGAAQYVFAIAGHPIRFCRGDDEDVAVRYRTPCFPEIQQQNSMFGLTQQDQTVLRLVISNESDGRPDDIWLMQLDEFGTILNAYLIPEVAASTVIHEFAPQPVPAVEIPPVSAEPVEADEDHATGAGSNDE